MAKFYKLLASIASRKDITGNAKVLLSVIANRIGRNGDCWPGVRTLAKDTGLSVDTVISCVRKLEKARLLIVTSNGKGRSNFYSIPPEALEGVERSALEEPVQVLEGVERQKSSASARRTSTEALEGVERNRTRTNKEPVGGAAGVKPKNEPEFVGAIKPLGASVELAGALSHLQECFRAAKNINPKIQTLDLEAFRDKLFRGEGCGRDGLNFARSFTDGDFISAWKAYCEKKVTKPQYHWTSTWVWNARSRRVEGVSQEENKALRVEQAKEIENVKVKKLVQEQAKQTKIFDEREKLKKEWEKLPLTERQRRIIIHKYEIIAMIEWQKEQK